VSPLRPIEYCIPYFSLNESDLTHHCFRFRSKFHREWNKRLEDKRAKEFDYEKSSRQAASEELGSWKTQRDVRMNAKKDKNRTEEQVLLETFESETEMLKIWDRVSKLIDTTEAGDSKGSDTSRMRKLFIQLKNEPLESTRATN
jgi:hypothetical protein